MHNLVAGVCPLARQREAPSAPHWSAMCCRRTRGQIPIGALEEVCRGTRQCSVSHQEASAQVRVERAAKRPLGYRQDGFAVVANNMAMASEDKDVAG